MDVMSSKSPLRRGVDSRTVLTASVAFVMCTMSATSALMKLARDLLAFCKCCANCIRLQSLLIACMGNGVMLMHSDCKIVRAFASILLGGRVPESL